jgi:uncharacterized iron-regulated membrane protein
MRNRRLLSGAILLMLSGILATTPAYAYVGPGLGAGAIAAVLGVLGSILAAILGVVYYPIKRRIKARKKAAQSDRISRNAE